MSNAVGQAVVILGATSAVAEHCARLWAERGARLVLVGRRQDRLSVIADDLRARGAPQVDVVVRDLAETPAEGHDAALASMAAPVGGRIDVLLVAYGVLGDQRTAEADPAAALALFGANMTSACAWLTVAAARMEQQGSGALVAISSVAGDRGRCSNYVYGAAKAGLSTFMEGLAHRFAASSVRVLLVKPGFIDSPMTADIAKSGPLWAKPEAIARDIDRALAGGRSVLYTPWFWAPIMTIIRHLPRFLFHRTKL